MLFHFLGIASQMLTRQPVRLLSMMEVLGLASSEEVKGLDCISTKIQEINCSRSASMVAGEVSARSPTVAVAEIPALTQSPGEHDVSPPTDVENVALEQCENNGLTEDSSHDSGIANARELASNVDEGVRRSQRLKTQPKRFQQFEIDLPPSITHTQLSSSSAISTVAANPQFPFKVIIEEFVRVSACVVGGMASRPNFGLNELNFVFSTLIVGSILNSTLMYLLAPTTSSSSTSSSRLPSIFASCPRSHMFELGTYTLMNRFGTFVL
ncbi:hypothetical protein COLO4_12157 [Corchorus olitorius]|uniref:Uncharacterized protein n=1 Tax=Corchorus olitorius TaxID=93759 RepID=A0A1R3K1Z1_9ROSI|nr:hypothetical protein COLO4_12157 [Corchorus olitorius]